MAGFTGYMSTDVRRIVSGGLIALMVPQCRHQRLSPRLKPSRTSSANTASELCHQQWSKGLRSAPNSLDLKPVTRHLQVQNNRDKDLNLSSYAAMDSIRLPERTKEILTTCMPGPNEPDFQTEGFFKWYVYTLDLAPKEAEKLACKGMEAFGIVEKEDCSTLGFLKAGKQDFPAPDIQHVLDQHVRLVEQQGILARQIRYSGDMDPWGFIVLTQADWREHGVVAVYIDEHRDKCKVRQCRIPVKEMPDLWSVAEGDISFDQVCDCYDDRGNDGPDDKGGPPPVGEWQFTVYCTGTLSWNGYGLGEVQDFIPDPRRFHAGYTEGESCLSYRRKELSADELNEDWPLEYAKSVMNPEIGNTGEYPVCKCHPSLFVPVHDHDPRDYKPSIINIVKLDWDHNIERSKEELKRMGRESKVTTQRCEAESLVETLLQMATGESIDSTRQLSL